MRVLIKDNYRDVSVEAGSMVTTTLRQKPGAVLGLATGSTPLGLYEELVRIHRDEGLDFSDVTTFNLDEYLGLTGDHTQSYRRFMDENLFDHINIRKEQTHVPDGSPPDGNAEKMCIEYEAAIRRAGGIDLQVLGIGGNGHIAFNEPGSSMASRTRLVALDERTIKDNARFYSSEDEVPRFALSMGIGTILEAREILLLATGEQKARAVAAAVEGPVTTQFPSSSLQLHPRVTIILDEAAASLLHNASRYRFIQEAEKQVGVQLF
ncbi:MAG: glucosamine-6-phosphate deaminase [delta proteobacterium MLS_D]|jgi:glucosamine-6-phosphate deaminase|nr:MAG: glucosamine-6-phosphate deaminase [delta proteobacterium MLS_D]